jgi:hypothetical protein
MILDNADAEDDGDGEGECDDDGEGEAEKVQYTHSIHNNDTHIIDLHTAIDINIVEYLSGGVRKIRYVDDSIIDVPIEPFSTADIVISDKGLCGGNLHIKVVFHNITLKKWKKISEKKRTRVIHLLTKMYP